MTATQDDLNRFHEFAVERLAHGDAEWELDELLMLWYDEQDRDSINAVIRQGLADIEAGRGRPARDVTEEFRQLYKFPRQ